MSGRRPSVGWFQRLGLDTHFGRFLAASVPLWGLLFALLEPSSSAGLGMLLRLLFWLAHAALALCCLAIATGLINRVKIMKSFNPWLRTLLAGIGGAALFAPFALTLEAVFPLLDDDGNDDTARLTLPGATLAEFTDLVLPLCVAWLLLNAPRLLQLNFATLNAEPKPRFSAAPIKPLAQINYTDNPFLAQLPPALGHDVIAISADLHYLHVYTRNGKTMLLYNLKDAVAALEPLGQQVHRSHWVATAHVIRLRRRQQQLFCVMSNELEIPVSRRRQKSIIELFGKDSKLSASSVPN